MLVLPPRCASSVRNRSPTTWRTARSRRSADGATKPRTASLSTAEPREPPAARTTKRSGGRPSASRAAARSRAGSTSSTARRSGAPVSLARGSPEPGKATADAAGEPGRQLAGATGPAVVADDDDGDAQPPGGEHGGQAGVAAHGDDDAGPARPEQRGRVPDGAAELGPEAEVAAVEPALDADHVEERVGQAGRWAPAASRSPAARRRSAGRPAGGRGRRGPRPPRGRGARGRPCRRR